MQQAKLPLLWAALIGLTICLTGFSAPRPSPTEPVPANTGAEVTRLSRWLLEGSAERMARRDTVASRLQAITRLTEIGTPQAVDTLYQYMLRPEVGRDLRQAALFALGKIGSPQSVAALTKYEQWVEEGHALPRPFSFGRKEFPVFHFRDHDVTPERQGSDGDGGSWAIFARAFFLPISGPSDRRDYWVTRSSDGQCWQPPILVGEAASPSLFLGGLRDDHAKLKPYLADADRDGLTDLFEARLGTDPKRADSDGDKIPDGKDSNPLTPRRPLKTDAEQIRQAAFLVFYGSSTSEYPLFIVQRSEPAYKRGKRLEMQPEFARQEYYGYRGPVVRVPSRREGGFNFTQLDVQITSATTATASIGEYEGNMAASETEVKLRKVHGKWVATEFGVQSVS